MVDISKPPGSFEWSCSLWDYPHIKEPIPYRIWLQGVMSEAGLPEVIDFRLSALEASWPRNTHNVGITKDTFGAVGRIWNRLLDDVTKTLRVGRAPLGVVVELAKLEDGSRLLLDDGDVYELSASGERTPVAIEDYDSWLQIYYGLGGPKSRRLSRQRWTVEQLAEVAAIYREASKQRISVNGAIQKRLLVGRTRASELIRAARDEGLLPPARRGKRQDV